MTTPSITTIEFLTLLCLVHFGNSELSYRLISFNFPNHNIGMNANGLVAITTTEEAFRIITPGLIGMLGTVSFESVRYPGRYLRHRGHVVHLDTFQEGNHLLFKQDASFYPRKGIYFRGYTAYESYNLPNYFIRHQNYILRISKAVNRPEELFKRDASFRVADISKRLIIACPALYLSYNFPDRAIGFTNDGLPGIVRNNTEMFIMEPGLNGQHGTISLRSERYPGHYLRHRNSTIHLDGFEEESTYFNDATFRLGRGLFQSRSVSFESFNYPQRYIRHQSYRLKLHANDGSSLFKNDASFISRCAEPNLFRREGPYRFLSKNFPQFTRGLDNSGIPRIVMSRDEKFYVVRPGLSGLEWTVSLASASFPGHYLRHRNYLLHLHSYEESKAYANDAIFVLRENQFYQGYITMESLSSTGYFIRHQGYRLKISRNDGSELFRKDSSFMVAMPTEANMVIKL